MKKEAKEKDINQILVELEMINKWKKQLLHH
jgi:hypothetical protein